jgi:hypothetical protein
MPMRRTDILVGLALISFVVIGCGGGDTGEPGIYYSEKGGFSIEFPDGWKKVKLKSEYETASAKDPKGKAIIMVTTKQVADYLTAEESLDIMIEGMGVYEHERDETTIDEKEALWSIYSATVDNIKYTYLSYVTIYGDRFYMISGWVDSNLFSDYEDVFRESADSFRFEWKRKH